MDRFRRWRRAPQGRDHARCCDRRPREEGGETMMSGINRSRRTLGCAALAALALAGTATWSHAANQAGSNVMTMKQDLANRQKDIHWPQGFDPSHADLFSHNELLINAPCERIWSHIIDAAKWPEWYPNSKEVKITGDTVLKDGAVFRWTTFG